VSRAEGTSYLSPG